MNVRYEEVAVFRDEVESKYAHNKCKISNKNKCTSYLQKVTKKMIKYFGKKFQQCLEYLIKCIHWKTYQDLLSILTEVSKIWETSSN